MLTIREIFVVKLLILESHDTSLIAHLLKRHAAHLIPGLQKFILTKSMTIRQKSGRSVAFSTNFWLDFIPSPVVVPTIWSKTYKGDITSYQRQLNSHTKDLTFWICVYSMILKDESHGLRFVHTLTWMLTK